MKNEIVIRAEIRPANYVFRHSLKDEWEEHKVLVHTTKTGMHGGYLLEDSDGVLFEVVVDANHFIRFADAMHKEYAWLPIDEVVSE